MVVIFFICQTFDKKKLILTKKFIDESKLLSLGLEKKSQQPFKCYRSFL